MIRKLFALGGLSLLVMMSLVSTSSANTTMSAAPTITTFTATMWHPPIGGGAFFHDGVVTQLGSIGSQQDPYRHIWDFDTATGEVTATVSDSCGWHAPPCPLVPLTSAFGIAYTGKVAYTLGGSQTWLEGDPTGKIFRYDPQSPSAMTYTNVDVGDCVLGSDGYYTGCLYDSTAVWDPVDRVVWELGGGDGTHYLSTVRWFDPERGTYETKFLGPRAGDNACGVWWGARDSVVWGGGHGGGVQYSDWYEIQPSGAFRKIGDMPQAIDFSACAIFGDYLIIAGGQKADGPVDTVYAMNLYTGETTQVATLPIPFQVYSFAVDQATGRMWLVSGADRVVLVQVN